MNSGIETAKYAKHAKAQRIGMKPPFTRQMKRVRSGAPGRAALFSRGSRSSRSIPSAVSRRTCIRISDPSFGRLGTITQTGVSATLRFQFYPDNNQPQLRVVGGENAGTRVTYTAVANSGAARAYRWYFAADGSTFVDTGNTSLAYTVDPANCSGAGTYKVVVSDGCNTPQEAPISLSVDPPEINLASATMRINPLGTDTSVYEWASADSDNDTLFDQGVIPSATLDSYTPPPSSSRYYRARGKRADGSVTGTIKFYFSGPSSITKVLASNATMDVTYTPKGFTGQNGWAYHWYFTPWGGSEDDRGKTPGPYSVSAVDCGSAGRYHVNIVDPCGTAADAYVELYCQ